MIEREEPKTRHNRHKRTKRWPLAIPAMILVLAVLVVLANLRRSAMVAEGSPLDRELDSIRASGSFASFQEFMDAAQKDAAEAQARGDMETQRRVVDFYYALKAEDFYVPDQKAEPKVIDKGLNLTDDAKPPAEWPPEVEAAVREVLDRNRVWIDKAIEISPLPPPGLGAVVNASQAKRLFDFKIPNLLAARYVANLLTLDGLLAIKEGRPDDALSNAGRILDIGNQMDSMPFIISHMISLALRSIGVNLVAKIVNNADCSDAAVDTFLAALDRSNRPEGLTRAYEMERLSGIDIFDMLRAGTFPHHAFGHHDPGMEAIQHAYESPLLRFLGDRDELMYLQIMNAIVDSTKRPYGQATAAIPDLVKDLDWRTPVSAIIIPNLLRGRMQQARHDAQLDMARAVLALRRFKRDTGAYPDRLDALVPAHLAAVPTDPFSGQPLLYRPENGGFVLYSVGENQKDDNGDAKNDADITWSMDH